MGADPAQLAHTLKVFLLSLALLALIPPVQAERAYWRQLQESAATGETEALIVLSLAYRDGWDGTIRPASPSSAAGNCAPNGTKFFTRSREGREASARLQEETETKRIMG